MPPTSSPPISLPSRKKAGAAEVWGAVFHPLGRSPKSAARFDNPVHGDGQGGSVSELHDEGRRSVGKISEIE
jgi:hypothetical protein